MTVVSSILYWEIYQRSRRQGHIPEVNMLSIGISTYPLPSLITFQIFICENRIGSVKIHLSWCYSIKNRNNVKPKHYEIIDTIKSGDSLKFKHYHKCSLSFVLSLTKITHLNFNKGYSINSHCSLNHLITDCHNSIHYTFILFITN